MESKENQLDNFLRNIPNGFEIPNEKFSNIGNRVGKFAPPTHPSLAIINTQKTSTCKTEK